MQIAGSDAFVHVFGGENLKAHVTGLVLSSLTRPVELLALTSSSIFSVVHVVASQLPHSTSFGHFFARPVSNGRLS